MTSCEHVDFPESKKQVRVYIDYSGFVILPISEGKCELKFITCRDIGGSMLAITTKALAESQPLLIEGIKLRVKSASFDPQPRIQKTRSAWKKFSARHTPTPEEKEDEVKSVNEQDDLKLQIDLDHPEGSFDGMVTAYNAAFELFGLLNAATRWKQHAQFDSLTISKTSHKKRRAKAFKAEVVLNATVEDVFLLLSDPVRRAWVSPMLTKWQTLAKVDSSTSIRSMIFQNNSGSVSCDARRFVIVEHGRKLSEGKAFLVARSVDPKLDETNLADSRTIDGVCFLEGWYLEPCPLNNQANSLLGCRATHFLQVEFGGKMSSEMKEFLVKKHMTSLIEIQQLL
jgi:hypothetical protein